MRDGSESDRLMREHEFSIEFIYRLHKITVPPKYMVIDESGRPSYVVGIFVGLLLLAMLYIPGLAVARIRRAYRIMVLGDREFLANLWSSAQDGCEDEDAI